MEKLNWDDYFMNVAKVISQKSSCSARQVGAILVKDKQIISTGYNGTPKGIKNCNEGGCPRCANRTETTSGKDLDKCTCCHAEENAIVQAALHGIKTKGSTLYTTFTACTQCSKMIINAGIKKIIADEDYPDEIGKQLLNEADVEFVKRNGEKV